MRGRRTLDKAAIAAIPITLALVLGGQWLEGGSVRSLVQGTAALIVFGGTFGATLLSFSWQDLRLAARSLRGVFYREPDTTDAIIGLMGQFAVKARKEGIMSLEDDLGRIQNPFLRRALGLAVDGTSPGTLRTMLESESLSREDRDEFPARVYEAAGGYAPTIGILGAVLGLIHVMENLSDPGRLGGGIAVAFVATVYGVGSANLVLLPVAARLRHRAIRLSRERDLIIEGVLAIQEGMNPRLIEQKLRGLVPREEATPGRRGRAA
jgi:chemotaxis protein MotA